MLENFSFEKNKRTIIIALKLPDTKEFDFYNSIEEMRLLALTLGLEVLNIFTQKRDKIEPDFFLGRGKLEEIKKYIDENRIESAIFDNELTGVQERNLEKILGVTIFGRTEIILNIFNKRAKTLEAKLQVKLASMEYLLPRLRNRWDHFSRIEGGIGMRGGEGEKQIELDKRIVKNEIAKIKKKLEKLEVQMDNRRKNRENENLVSLVGYTNAGKSSLMNLLAKTNLYVENMLFATLDNTVRRVYINENLIILLNDTVGFINKLPHSLVASFKSTLKEIASSKLILHVIDISSPAMETHIKSVNSVLEEIGASSIPIIKVYNKIDLIDLNNYQDLNGNENSVFISVKNNIGIENLKQKILQFF
ncbi:MAG TPA: GTPase HflX [Spirochaetota bacterium]|nr:GTPase HflX [Spirochaetota bacterium]HOL56962.1 GTPase HflX [Spirochaetota bacterium]HPP04435.1 GTPase HflX [Spirochaetota bacterium]